MKPIHKAITLVGQSALARICGVSPQFVYQWKKGRPIPERHCPTIEIATDGKVQVEDLRPDLAEFWAWCRAPKKPRRRLQ